MLTRYLAGFSTYFMQGVLSLLTSYDAVMVGYTCRNGKESLEMYRRGIYRLFILQQLLPSPEYTIANFYSMFCDCSSCGVGPRISLYSWEFLPRFQREIQSYERLPPVFDKKCRECAVEQLYRWFYVEGNSVWIYNPNASYLDYEEEDYDDDEIEKYTCFGVIPWNPSNSKYSSSLKCMCCKMKVTSEDRVVGVLINEEIYSFADTYHIGCFFDQFAVWKCSSELSLEQQTLPSIEVF